jgi:hypothetical protein
MRLTVQRHERSTAGVATVSTPRQTTGARTRPAPYQNPSAWQGQPRGPCKALPLERPTRTPAPSGSFEGSLGVRAQGCRHAVGAVSFLSFD